MNDMLLEYIDRIIDEEKDHRVFSVEFNDKTYYVKPISVITAPVGLNQLLELLLIMSFIKFPS